MVPAATCALIIGSNVAASLRLYPRAGKWFVSTKPKTHISWVVGRPLWCYKMNTYHIDISDITLETLYIPLVMSKVFENTASSNTFSSLTSI